MTADVERRRFGVSSFTGIAAAPFADGVVLHDGATGRLFFLNSTAGQVWHYLLSGHGEDAAAAALAAEHGVGVSDAARDVRGFVAALHEEGLLRVDDSGKPPRLTPPATAPALDRVFRIGDRSTRVICHECDVATSFAALTAPAAYDAAAGESILTLFRRGDDYCLLRDGRLLQRLSTAPLARWALVRELVRGARERSWLALLHAGALAAPGGALLIAGDSGAGKSTLLCGLLASALAFIADDISPIEEGTGDVWPVPLAISIKEGSWKTVAGLFPELKTRPAIRFGTRTMRYLTLPQPLAEAGCPLALAVFPNYTPDAPVEISRLDIRESLILLGEGGSVLPDSDAGLSAFLSLWNALPAYRITYGRLEDAVAAIRELLGADRAPQATATRCSA